jgi:hypothetical protein
VSHFGISVFHNDAQPVANHLQSCLTPVSRSPQMSSYRFPIFLTTVSTITTARSTTIHASFHKRIVSPLMSKMRSSGIPMTRPVR